MTMTFLRPISQCLSTQIGAGVAASKDVISRKRCGRHAVAISADSDIYVGDEKTQKLKIKAGETMIFPVSTDRFDQLYVSGAATITEFF